MAGYLAACAIFKDEGPYLAEWLEFHLLVGFEHLFLYDNRSEDDFAQVLARYVAEGAVTLTDWPEFRAADRVRPLPPQSGWQLALDGLHRPRRVRVLAASCGRCRDPRPVRAPSGHRGAVGAVRHRPGHVSRPPGLAIESYVQRFVGRRHLRQFKSVVDLSAVTRAYGPHSFAFRDPSWPSPVPRFAPWSELRVNHYLTRSEEEYRGKLAPRTPSGTPQRGAQAAMRS